MKKKLQILSVSLALASTMSILHAEGKAPAPANAPYLHPVGNISAGKQKSASCTSCHGENGNSMVATFPKLAQQHSSYLERQLRAFKDGSRNDPMMSAMALALSDEDIIDISTYYAAQKISENTLPVLEPADDNDEKPSGNKNTIEAIIAQGSDLYRNGNLTSEVSACIACHGPFGEGNKPASFPALKSQHADYLIKTLTDYKSGSRSNNPENIMHMIAKKMTNEEIKAVSYRISMMK
jgi:cytochrome c553